MRLSKMHRRVLLKKRQRGFFCFGGGVASARGFQIANSLRFRAGNAAYGTWTSGGSPTDNKKVTFFFAVKAAPSTPINTANQYAFVCTAGNNGIIAVNNAGLGGKFFVRTDGGNDLTFPFVMRNPIAHTLIQVTIDTTQATASNRIKVWKNMELQTAVSGSQPAQNSVCSLNAASTAFYLMRDIINGNYMDGILSHFCMVDGQALDETYFTERNADGVPVIKNYAGTWGTNGRHYTFSDAASTTTLGYDTSGNANHMTLSGISLTSGQSYDHMVDTPTKNYPAMSSIFSSTTATSVYNAGLEVSFTSGSYWARSPFIIPATGKWYFEFLPITIPGDTRTPGVGVALCSAPNNPTFDTTTASVAWTLSCYSGNKQHASSAAYGSAFTAGTTVGCCAIDRSTNSIWWGTVSGGTITWFASGDPAAGTNAAFTNLSTGDIAPVVTCDVGAAAAVALNFGQRPLAASSLPSGFKVINTENMPAVAIPNPSLHHYVTAITKSGDTSFTLPWNADTYDTLFEIKDRGLGNKWYRLNGLRGYNKYISSNSTAAETTDANVLGVAGTTITLKSSLADGAYLIRAWKAGLASARQTNASGSITSTVSANATAGFSMVSFSGTSANATVGHGLGVALDMLEVKNLGPISTYGSVIWHKALTSAGYYLALDGQAAEAPDSGAFNSTAPTSTVFSVGANNNTNQSTKDMLAFCWAGVVGYSKFDSATGNGSTDGVCRSLGFTPASTVAKVSSGTTGHWNLICEATDTYNPTSHYLLMNAGNVEATDTTRAFDLLAGSIKGRSSHSDVNQSSAGYIGASFAKYPFGGANVAPAPAR